MPYIRQELRERFEPALDPSMIPTNAGELNYLISSITRMYLAQRCLLDGTYAANYQAHNDVMGVLECAKMELYRRETAPYEDQKILENGDI